MMNNDYITMTTMYNGFGIKVGTMYYDELTGEYFVEYSIPDYDYYEGKLDDENF